MLPNVQGIGVCTCTPACRGGLRSVRRVTRGHREVGVDLECEAQLGELARRGGGPSTELFYSTQAVADGVSVDEQLLCCRVDVSADVDPGAKVSNSDSRSSLGSA